MQFPDQAISLTFKALSAGTSPARVSSSNAGPATSEPITARSYTATHPRAEEWLWRPDIQQRKWSQSGIQNLRYKTSLKRQWLDGSVAG